MPRRRQRRRVRSNVVARLGAAPFSSEAVDDTAQEDEEVDVIYFDTSLETPLDDDTDQVRLWKNRIAKIRADMIKYRDESIAEKESDNYDPFESFYWYSLEMGRLEQDLARAQDELLVELEMAVRIPYDCMVPDHYYIVTLEDLERAERRAREAEDRAALKAEAVRPTYGTCDPGPLPNDFVMRRRGCRKLRR